MSGVELCVNMYTRIALSGFYFIEVYFETTDLAVDHCFSSVRIKPIGSLREIGN